jgi:putative phage-type endonuclease
VEQNSPEWLEYRRGGVGSSDAPVIMGVSPYMTLRELWLDKKGRFERQKKSEFVLRLGQEFEIKARARFELETGIVVEPECVEHESEPWLRASLDACSIEERTFVEIKYMGEKNFDLVQDGQVLTHHFPQLQHQFMVTGFESAYYSVYTLSEDKKEFGRSHTMKILPDRLYIETLLYPACRKFWDSVLNNVEPVDPPKIRKRRTKNV